MNTTTISPERSYIAPRNVRALQLGAQDAADYQSFAAIGLNFPERIVARMAAAFDGLEAPTLTNTITTPVQFLQNWLPGFVYVMTQPRSIDELIGITTIGDAIDEEIVQPTLEHAGKTALYGDLTNIPLAGVGNGFERRTITRHEMGLRVGWLEEQRAGRAAVNVASEKRAAAGLALEITRNRIGFYGFNNGVNLTYGFLNDPGLPAYVSVPAGVGGTTWALKTMDEICGDIRIILGALQDGSKGLINVRTTPITLAVSLAVVNQLTKINAFGMSVEDWLAKAYPNVTVKASVDLNGANGGANVMYAYAETVPGTGTDSGRVIEQFVQSKFQMLGSEKGAKHYTEDFLMATAGVMVKRPWAVKRYTGL
jgi:hypothetical protein